MNKEELYEALEAMGPEMSANERMMNYMTGQPTDCIPYGLIGFEEAVARHLGYTMQQYRSSYDVRAEVIRFKEEKLNMVGTTVALGLRTLGNAVGSELAYPEDNMDLILHHVCEDYDEFFASIEDFDVLTNPVLAPMLDEAKQLMADFPHMEIATGVTGPFSNAAAIRPVEKLLRDTRKNPEAVHRLLDFCVDATLQWVKVFHEQTGATSTSIADPVTTTDILSRKQFLEFSKPYLKRLFDGMVEITGKAPMLHICGHTKGLWEDLVEMGFPLFSLDNCESLAEASEMVGDRMMLVGNVPPVEALMLGTIDDVIEATRKCIIEGAANPRGFMLNTGCQVPAGVPLENIVAMKYAARKYGANAVFGQVPEAALQA